MNYEQLDFIADAYIPILILISIIVIARYAYKVSSEKAERKTALKNSFVLIFSGILQCYVLMVLDLALGIWPRFGLDFSTHTALALVFIVFLSFINLRFCIFAAVSMIAYALLMRYQQYHSYLDMLTTAMVMLPLLLGMNKRLNVLSRAIRGR